MSKFTEITLSLEDMTETCDVDTYSKVLHTWTTLSPSMSKFNDGLKILLLEVHKYMRDDLLNVIIESMQSGSVDNFDSLAHITQLTLGDDFFLFLQAFRNDFIAVPVYLALFNYFDEACLDISFENLSGCFDLELDEIDMLLEKGKDGSAYVIYHLESKKQVLESFAPLPQWVLLSEVISTHSELVSALTLNTEVRVLEIHGSEDVESYTSDIRSLGSGDAEAVANAVEDIIKTVGALSMEDRVDQFETYLKLKVETSLAADRDVFKVFGPCCVPEDINELDTNGYDPCRMYGGCRMITCYHNENYDSDDETQDLVEDIIYKQLFHQVDWFTGSCESCKLKIKARHYATRLPVPSGGWLGCYCSWKCVSEDAALREPPNNYSLEFIQQLIDIFKTQCDDIGVFDRVYDTEHEVWV